MANAMKMLMVSGAVLACASAPALSETKIETQGWVVDSEQTRVNFSVRHMMISRVRGGFNKVHGKVHYDGKELKTATVEATIEADSIDTKSEQRDTHLKSADFLEVSKYPTIKFVSTKIAPTTTGFEIEGNLSLHGTTRPVLLQATAPAGPSQGADGKMHVTTSATTKINRKDFGMSFSKQLDNGNALVGDEVEIDLAVDLVKVGK